MGALTLVFLISGICCGEILCYNATTTEKIVIVNPQGRSVSNKNENQTQQRQLSWRDLVYPERKSLQTEEAKMIANTKLGSTNRKSKLLGSLAFLAGLGVGGLAGAASTTAKAYAKMPHASFALNFGGPGIPPHYPAYYDPYYTPYVYAGPFGFYPLLDPSRLQSLAGGPVQNGLQPVTQNQLPSQVLSLLDSKRPIDLLNNNEEYTDEEKKSENEKTLNDVEEETDENAELRLEDDRNAEEKTVRRATCTVPKLSYKKPANSRERDDLQQDAGSLAALSVRAANGTTNKTHHHRPHKHNNSSNIPQPIPGQNIPGRPKPNNTKPDSNPFPNTPPPTINPITNETTISPGNNTQNSTENNNQAHPPFGGYYVGSPQNIDHVDFTTAVNPFSYQDYAQINYNLPHERPANFRHDDKYSYYHSPGNSFNQNSYPVQFQQDQIPEYYTNDFSRLLYTPDNAPQFVNGFRPVA